MSPTGASREPDVEIRVRNASTLDFDRVHVQFPQTGGVDYGAVPSGGSSEFHTTMRAFAYAPVRVQSGQDQLVFQPMDYVGESELDPGRYTYVLGVDSGVLTITLQRERQGDDDEECSPGSEHTDPDP